MNLLRVVVRTIAGGGVIVVCIVCLSLHLAMAQRPFPPLESDPDLAKELPATAHKKLKQKKIPFDPNMVVKDGWRQRIDPALWDVPELNRNLRVNEPMEGVYLANLLMVGEDVKLKGDTLLLIKELAPDDENRNLKISGKGDFFIFIVGPEKKIRLRGPRGKILIQTTGRCFVAGFPQGYEVLITCGRRGFVLP